FGSDVVEWRGFLALWVLHPIGEPGLYDHEARDFKVVQGRLYRRKGPLTDPKCLAGLIIFKRLGIACCVTRHCFCAARIASRNVAAPVALGYVPLPKRVQPKKRCA